MKDKNLKIIKKVRKIITKRTGRYLSLREAKNIAIANGIIPDSKEGGYEKSN
ncbi:MAG: hypothetical protein HY096_09870 [Nitrospinae bacterium]|nr:hypothetical protein [Nitrospinota bacterium]